jgi:anaerobic dimethyl sulfoxide reductase subunit B (iron-sulfur subunit)
MCTFCVDRVAENKKPICVDACPMRALDAGPLEELKAQHGEVQQVEGFTYAKKTKPSIIFKPRYRTE